MPAFAHAATLTVTKLADTNDGTCDTDCSLREAIAASSAGDIITFANGLSGTITLSGTKLTVSHTLTIQGPGASVLTISGNDLSQVIDVIAGANLGDMATFSLSGITIAHGFTTDYTGGGLYVENYYITTTVSQVIFDHNVADGEGAGARLNGTTTVQDSIFSNNVLARNSASVSNTWGSGLSCDRNECTVTGTLFTGNSGGCSALYSAATHTTFANDTSTGNDFPAGCNDPGNIEPGGIVCDSSEPSGTCSFNNVTSYGNTLNGSVSHADGIAVGDGIALHISNSIVDGCGGSFYGGSIVSDGYNIDVGNTCGFSATGDQHNADPLLAALADNGGFTKTLALLSGSLAINAGNPATPIGSGGTCEVTDQRGTTRPQGPSCDIGAFEYVIPAPTPTPTPAPTTHHGGSSAVICFGGLVWTPSKLACALPDQLVTASTTTTPTTIPAATSSPSGISFLTNHKLGDRGEGIRMLQKFLNTHGFILATSGAGSPGNETTLFGALTKAALIKFQRANSIVPAVGYFGPLTRAFITRVLGSTASTP
jgi:CSLREA domain-containing protein